MRKRRGWKHFCITNCNYDNPLLIIMFFSEKLLQIKKKKMKRKKSRMHKHQMLKNGSQSVSFFRFSTFSCVCFVSHFIGKCFSSSYLGFHPATRGHVTSYYRWLTARRCSPACRPVGGAPWSWQAACGPPRCSRAPSATGIPSAGRKWRKALLQCWFHTAAAPLIGERITLGPVLSERNPPEESRSNQTDLHCRSGALWHAVAVLPCD